MSVVLERAAIGTLFVTEWTALGSGGNLLTPVVVPNSEVDDSDSSPTGEYARLSIVQAPEVLTLTFGSKSDRRHPGVVLVSLYTPLGTGDLRALQLGEYAAGIFRATRTIDLIDEDLVTVGKLRFREPAVRAIGKNPKKTHYQVNCSVPFNRDYLS